MSSGSSSMSFFGIREDQNQLKPQPTSTTAQPGAQPKKKRNLPGTPNPDAEVIALSPKTLMATNRFICEVCNKGFQREQNLQLHRRGHNLPWKLRQKTTKEVRRKVYLCPEPTCVHHDPSRALGDLTGIKKHFCRKHGEKKWKCDKCSKKYAVQSDWKAHSKTCGTREYRCDCGTLFARRDSFITHRAFCDALAQESAKLPPNLNTIGTQLFGNNTMGLTLPQVGSQISSLQDQNQTSSDILRLGGNTTGSLFDPSPFRSSSSFFLPNQIQDFNEQHENQAGLLPNKTLQGLMQYSDIQNNTNGSSSASASSANPFNIVSNNNGGNNHLSSAGLMIHDQFSQSLINDQMGQRVSSMYNQGVQNESVIPQMSATALLQKAAQMGSTSSNPSSSFLKGFACSSSKEDNTFMSGSFKGSFNSGGGDIIRLQTDNQTPFENFMNSLTSGGNSSIFGGGSSTFAGNCNTGGQDQETGFANFNMNRVFMDQQHPTSNTNISNMNENNKLQRNLAMSSVGGGNDRLTRDFLGVSGMKMGSLDAELKSAAASSRGFGGGNLR